MNKKILIVGDSCIDVYEYGTCDRISPEAPIPVFKPTNVVESGGMVLNVKNNVEALGHECVTITNIEKPIKHRYVDIVSNQQIIRVDKNDTVVEKFDHDLLNYLPYSAIVISDYDKGFITEDNINFLSKQNKFTFLDSKKQLGDWCNDIFLIKLNEKELKKNISYLTTEYKNNLIITHGDGGATFYNENKTFKPEKNVYVSDVAGAGDTFLAAFVVSFLKNNDICKSIEFANKCASWVVSQRGVAVVNINKIENNG